MATPSQFDAFIILSRVQYAERLEIRKTSEERKRQKLNVRGSSWHRIGRQNLRHH
jgi:hypothetical protein